MPKDSARRTRGEAGVSAVEFGLILPIFMILLLGILDYGYLYFVHLSMTNAAREGARVGVTQCNATSAAQAAATSYLTGAGVTATVVPPTLTGNNLQVTVQRNPFVPLVGFVPVPASLRASASMRWELADAPELCP